MADKHAIPQRYIDLCAEVARLCRAEGLGSASFSFRPGWLQKDWSDQIQMVWDCGRHDEAVDRFTVSSTVIVAAKIEQLREAPHSEGQEP